MRKGRNNKQIKASEKGINFAQPLTMKKKILVADDDPGIRDIFKIIFERAGYSIEIKDDAEDVLRNNFTNLFHIHLPIHIHLSIHVHLCL